jgi:hypothetical protein
MIRTALRGGRGSGDREHDEQQGASGGRSSRSCDGDASRLSFLATARITADAAEYFGLPGDRTIVMGSRVGL